jgi:hypothetical protein
MRTFKLWLINDPDIPGFKKLAWDVVEVEIRDVLEQGIHPWGDRDTCRTLMERFLQVLNDDRFNIPELADLGYCDAFASHTNHYRGEQNQFEELLSRINQSVRFVGSLGYRQMLDLARQQLRQNWNHRLVRQLIGRIYYNFNDLRGFIKSVNKGVKLRSYDDLNNYDLARVLALEDFEAEDSVLISEGLPVTNFRPESWLTEVTNSEGLLKLTESIDDFELYPPNTPTGYGHSRLIYHGSRRKNEIRLTPTLNNNRAVRTEARNLARRWRTDDGTYCFTTDISKLTEMLADGDMQIRFPRLDYVRKRDPAVSTAQLNGSALPRYSIGRFVTARCSGDTIKGILRRYQVPMTGTKEVLLEKLSALACQQYRKHKEEMGDFFRQNRCIKVGGGSGCKSERFPVLEEVELRNLLLTMFALKHLRGNAILDATYENDTLDCLALAQSLIKEEISLSGVFLEVQG